MIYVHLSPQHNFIIHKMFSTVLPHCDFDNLKNVNIFKMHRLRTLTQCAFFFLNSVPTWFSRPPATVAFLGACMLSHFSRVQLFATSWTVAHQAFLSMGVLQARILDWVSVPFSKGSSWTRDQTHISYISCIGRFFTTSTIWEA